MLWVWGVGEGERERERKIQREGVLKRVDRSEHKQIFKVQIDRVYIEGARFLGDSMHPHHAPLQCHRTELGREGGERHPCLGKAMIERGWVRKKEQREMSTNRDTGYFYRVYIDDADVC